MTDETKKARIIEAMNETERQLVKAKKRYTTSTRCLKMEVQDYGADVIDNCPWLDYCLHDKERVKKLEAHMAKLQAMLLEAA